MAGVVHISEAEAARDFAALMRRVRAGDEVVVEDGGKPVAVLKAVEPTSGAVAVPAGRPVEEIIARLEEWEREHGPLRMGADFADDVEEAHRRYNQRMEEKAFLDQSWTE